MLLFGSGCAHSPMSGRALNRMIRPALVARIEDGAGPKSFVFREDSSYGSKLKKLDPKEADRRLQVKLAKGVTRFEVSDSLRANTLATLPRENPWMQAVDPAQVARALESFLVEEVPANAPDYNLLRPLGTDSVVEFVIEEYGMRSSSGRAGLYVLGHVRMFFLDGGGTQYFRAFRADEVRSGLPHLDPFAVAKDPAMFRRHMTQVMIKVAELVANDLNPPRGGPVEPTRTEADQSGGERKKLFVPRKDEGGELPDPDPI